jgi:hypothetical protein
MGYPKLSIIFNGFFLTIWVTITVICFRMNTVVGYLLGLGFFGLSCYGAYYFYRVLWLHNWGRPLSEEKKRKRDQMRRQMRDYQRYNLYHRLYRFADATEDEYQAEKVQEVLKKIKRK